jgi:hypothetical protein
MEKRSGGDKKVIDSDPTIGQEGGGASARYNGKRGVSTWIFPYHPNIK